ncbi:uncharacterized protein RHO25_003977 [Cercospora beticola]|nr:hypothetical protein RHO25_003977 [Cercospora beticola]
MFLLLILLALVQYSMAQASSATCYTPSGNISAGDRPCNSSAEVSACCAPDALCLSSGLCFRSNRLSRGSCTDRSWGDNCAAYCRDANPGGGMPISACDVAGNFACDIAPQASRACANGNTFKINEPFAIMLRPEQTLQLGYTGGLEVFPSSNLTSNITSNATASTRPPGSGPPPAVIQQWCSGLSSKKYTAGAMAGVGAGVGIPLLLALVAALWYIKKLRGQQQQRFVDPAPQYVQETAIEPGYEDNKPYKAEAHPYEMGTEDGRRELE